MKIFINSGHCLGVDNGACAFDLKEAQIALNISKRVQHYLQAVGYTVKSFYSDSLQQICDDANSWGADLFVSIHCNAFDGNVKGSETFHSGSNTSRNLAIAIQNQLAEKIPTVNRGVKLADFYVLKYTNAPAVLVETAFIDNPSDAKLLRDRQDDFARAVACGITDFFADNKNLPAKNDSLQPFGKLSPHFDATEFACHHCDAITTIDPRLLELLEQLRSNIGNLPIHINSGYRCPVHNANVGGVPNSQHVLGTAADLAVPRQLTFNQFKWYVTQLPFDWVGLYPISNFIHVDTRAGGICYHQGDLME